MLRDEVVMNKILMQGRHESVITSILQINAIIYAGIVDKAIDPIVFPDYFLNCLFTLKRIRKLSHNLESLVVYFLKGLDIVLLILANNNRDGLLGSECLNNSLSNAPRPSGDNDDFICKTEVHDLKIIKSSGIFTHHQELFI